MKLNEDIEIDLPRLIETRLLVQANSGGGKSWLLRRILEQSHGKVQQIILDPEGEFGTLREKHDYILAGKDGDTPAQPRSAALLARKLLELRVSAVIDLYELSPQQRKSFVRLFLDAMINAPKELYHEVLVVLDEAHMFAPEKGKSESAGAVIDLCTRGRKRGFCAVLATQRISKLAKDAAAECNNKLIGRTGLDIDMKRAAEELGFTNKEQLHSLRGLKPGEFYAFGTAISEEVIKLKIGSVTTSHPKVGSRTLAQTAPPTKAIKKILGKLGDLPKEAKEEAKTVADLKAQIRELERTARRPDGISKEKEKEYLAMIKEMERAVKTEQRKIKRIAEIIGRPIEISHVDSNNMPPPLIKKTPVRSVGVHSGIDDLTNPEKRILSAVAWLESIGVSPAEQPAVAFLAGYTAGGGGFNNPKGSLRTKGLIEYQSKKLLLTDSGRELAEIPDEPLTQEELHKKILDILPTPESRILTPLLNTYPDAIGNDELAEMAGYAPRSGGFNNPKGRLRTLGLIEYPESGLARARNILFFN